MMQGLSGMELCTQIKENPSLSHIPIILLTASSSSEAKLQGIECGADDYITKPFEKELLQARVAGILKSRNTLQSYFYNEITLKSNNLKISKEYKDFLDRCMQIVENHLTDPEFGIKVLAEEIGMSKSNLYVKIKSISGQSSNSFIRFIRLRKAAEIFISTDSTVYETAYLVGIKDLKYFREQFHKQFNMNPSDYIKKYRKPFHNNFNLNKEIVRKG
jgi:YesN/AraC family two-component response regulator